MALIGSCWGTFTGTPAGAGRSSNISFYSSKHQIYLNPEKLHLQMIFSGFYMSNREV
jgi:hypothetical protein